ncbi:MAG: ATP-binding protein [Myxococcota bacterium]|nr:ATP-binding protein [Myxococcota bacterium]
MYLLFAGVFLQQGLINVSFGKNNSSPELKYLKRFAFASAAICLALYGTTVAPFFDIGPKGIRFLFHLCWLVAPVAGYLYVRTLTAHLGLELRQVRFFVAAYALVMLIVSTSVIYALVTGEHIIFSSQPPAAASVVMVHLGGAFSPNDVTLLLSGFIALNVLISMVFFLRQVRAKARPDRSLVFGISLTGVAIVIELLGFLFQWSYAFSLMPMANAVEVVRLTYLNLIGAGRDLEKSQVELRRERLNLKTHLAALAHDVRTPLASLKLGIGRLGANIDTSGKLAQEVEYLHIVFSSLVTLFEVELSSVRVSREKTRIDSILSALSHRFSNLARERGIVFECAVDSAQLVTESDSTLCEQSLGNLIYNALIHARERVSVSAYAEGSDVVVRVMDDGDASETISMPKLSDRLYRHRLETGLGSPGWGLSLAIAYALSRLQNDELRNIESEQGIMVFEYRFRTHRPVASHQMDASNLRASAWLESER